MDVECTLYIVKGVFETGTPLKVLSVRLHRKSHRKSVKIYSLGGT